MKLWRRTPEDAESSRDDEGVSYVGRPKSLAILGYVAMAVSLIIVLVPVYWIVVASFKVQGDIYTSPATYWPHPFTTQNYDTVRTQIAFGTYLRNSVIITLILSSAKILLGVTSAYALALLRFPGRNLCFIVIIASLMVPNQITVISNYSLIAGLGMRNSFAGIILPLAGTAFGTFLMRNHFLSLPTEVIEAARMDGASPLRLLTRVVLPMSWPTLSAFALITIVNDWNEYLWPFLMSDDEKTAPLQIGLTFLQNNEGLTNWGPVMAGTVLAVLPVLIVFVLLQKNMIKGLTSGAVKG
ncbi:MAG: carbohydrate ABC transporter permease [Actinomycetaceae bacterium]|nr:carbohydrate ABC transporter permease [Actinomycetaceae bacterium]MDU0970103.1 carbohydrate ABC transporter permease [Actinomycetaceae bacterium]